MIVGELGKSSKGMWGNIEGEMGKAWKYKENLNEIPRNPEFPLKKQNNITKFLGNSQMSAKFKKFRGNFGARVRPMQPPTTISLQ